MTRPKFIFALTATLLFACGPEEPGGGLLDGAGTGDGLDGGLQDGSRDFNGGSNDLVGADDGSVCNAINAKAEAIKLPSDIIFVIDNSGSMKEEIEYVRQNIVQFSQDLQGAGIDFRLIMITNFTKDKDQQGTDANKVTVPEPLKSDSQRFLAVDQFVDSHNSFDLILSTYNSWHQFLRPNSFRHVVVATDDNADFDYNNFDTQLKAKPGFEKYRFHAIVADLPVSPFTCRDRKGECYPPPPSAEMCMPGSSCKEEGCCDSHFDNPCWINGAAVGTQYIDLQKKTGGVLSRMCVADWAPVFNNLKTAVVGGATLPCNFAIPPKPPNVEDVDYEKVNMIYNPSSGAAVTIPRVQNQAACGNRTAWYYDNVNNPTKLLACPNACSTFSADPTGRIDVAFGCKGIIIM